MGDQIRICHQFVGYTYYFNYCDAADHQLLPTKFAATSIRRTEETKNDYENESAQFSHISQLNLRPLKYLEPPFVLILKQWNDSKDEETLQVGSIGQKVRKKWIDER